MTSRTNHCPEGQNQSETMRALPSALEQRRQEAVARYLAGDPIEVICREMDCSKSWLYKWKRRYQATEPDWFQERSRRPETTPTKTSDALEAEIVRLRNTLPPRGAGAARAGAIRDYLRQHGAQSIPSRRTIYRILNRLTKEVNSQDFTS
jgi:transposase-like protein